MKKSPKKNSLKEICNSVRYIISTNWLECKKIPPKSIGFIAIKFENYRLPKIAEVIYDQNDAESKKFQINPNKWNMDKIIYDLKNKRWLVSPFMGIPTHWKKL